MRVTRWRRPHVGDERGATLVIVVLALMAIFGMVVLVVDVGGALVVRQQMIRSADSASLAAAQSFAIEEALCGVDESAARQQADTYAVYNASGTTVIGFATDCGASEVTVDVQSSLRRYFFAPIIGGPSQRYVHATATAIWGPLGGGSAVPIVLDSGMLQGVCDVPDGIEIDDTCAFWYDSNDLGNASWGFMNLDQWNVAGDENCSNAGANDRSEWIDNGYPEPLYLNGDPPGNQSTYVCVDTGHTTRDWRDLRAAEGEVKLFPVNDCNGQLDKDGNVAPCPATPDKYDIIGFTSLLMLYVYKGDDPDAIGTVGASGTCSRNNQDIGDFATLNLDSFAGSGGGCPSSAPDNIPYSGVTISPKTGPDFIKCTPPDAGPCDYRYDEDTHVVTWLGPAVSQARISFDWSNDGTQGACGSRPSDPNAICLVTQWKGFTVGESVGEGPDLGARGVRLVE